MMATELTLVIRFDHEPPPSSDWFERVLNDELDDGIVIEHETEEV
jgi:hypothetical protein